MNRHPSIVAMIRVRGKGYLAGRVASFQAIPRPDDVMHLVDEIERRLSSLAQDGKQLVYRAMLLRALQEWREFGTLVFAERWLA